MFILSNIFKLFVYIHDIVMHYNYINYIIIVKNIVVTIINYTINKTILY
jgi:hypothetical protein